MNALGRAVHLPGFEIPVKLLCQKRSYRGKQAGQSGQRPVQRLVRGALVDIVLALPEPAAAAAHIPVGQAVDELLDLARGIVRPPVIEPVGNGPGEFVQLRDQPAIEFGQLKIIVNLIGCPAVQIGVRHEERVDVPQRDEELAAHLVANGVTEVHVGCRVVTRKQPAHHVDTHLVGSIFEED